jgi:hypothetical protein
LSQLPINSTTFRSILDDYRLLGECVWERFKGGKEGTLWYYRSVVEAFRKAGSTPLVDELERVVSELEFVVGHSAISIPNNN